MKNIYIKRIVVLLLVLWISGCTVFPPKVDNVPWRSEISQRGCPNVNGRYKDPENVAFDAFLAGHYRYSGISNNRISGYQYIEFPYYSLPWRDGYKAKLEFNLENSVNIHIDGPIVTLELFHSGVLYQEQKRKLNYYMIGCSQGSYVFRDFSTGSMVELGPIVTFVTEHYIKKENNGSLVIDKYRREWVRTANLDSKPRKEEHKRYVLEPVREK